MAAQLRYGRIRVCRSRTGTVSADRLLSGIRAGAGIPRELRDRRPIQTSRSDVSRTGDRRTVSRSQYSTALWVGGGGSRYGKNRGGVRVPRNGERNLRRCRVAGGAAGARGGVSN